MLKRNKLFRGAVILLAVALTTAFCTVCAQDLFAAERSYREGEFTDVPREAWYYNDVKAAYELGLINGMGDGIFDPDSSMTVAQGIALAARMHTTYYKGQALIQRGDWYDVYVEYALEKGIIANGQFDSFTREIKRHEMASLFANALPAEQYDAINQVIKIPDVPVSALYYDDVMLLYRAGVVMGSDEYGTFNPAANIKRSEVSAIISRAALPANRLEKTLVLKSMGNAYHLAYDYSYNYRYGNTVSGWSLDNRGGSPRTSETGEIFLNDISREFGSAIVRDLTYTNNGVVTLETSLTFLQGFDGLSVEFLDEKKQPAYRLYTEKNAFYLADGENAAKKLYDSEGGKTYDLRVTLDFNTGTSETVINRHSYADAPLLSDHIKAYRIGSTDKDMLNMKQGLTNIYVDYAVFDEFNLGSSGEVPYLWNADVSSQGVQSAAIGGEYHMKTPATGGVAKASRSFDAVQGTVCFETLFFLPDLSPEVTISLNSGETEALGFAAKDGSFHANGESMRAIQANMWYTIRLEADLETQTALIKTNGKKLGTVSLKNGVPFVDNITFTFAADGAALARFDEIKVHRLVEYDDYISRPVKPAGEEKYNIGINVCSLWRNGTHGGWDCITPFDEIKPLLGYYDEGLPEVADWEIKWMVEHGIDFQLFCWYSSQANAPIKTTGLSAAIHDGYFNAKYSDEMKFALLWEAANAQHPAGSEAFRKYFVPYWVEYFFSDDRYMTIDNKLVIAVFGAGQLVQDFGSPAGVKAEFDYVRQVAKSLGFDGAIFMATSGPSQTIKDCGFDAVYAYNWGSAGYSPEHTKNQITNQQNTNLLHVVPTISTGFNDIGWHGTRFPNMTVSDFKETNEWVRDVALKKYENETEGWKKNLVMLSTWNEYGEGTYIMPSGLNGFGYLDALREVYTNGGLHLDETPTENQLSRLGYLFPQDRAIIRPLRWYTGKAPDSVVYDWDFSNSKTYAKWDWWSITASREDGAVSGTSTGDDPIIIMKEPEPISLANVTHIKVRIKAPKGNTLQVFFTTGADGSWSEAKSAKATITSDEMTDYYLNMQSNVAWKGTLEKLRVDPMNGSSLSFVLESVQLMRPEDQTKISINNEEQTFDVDMVEENGYHLIPFNPQRGIFFAINAYHEWDKARGVLSVYAGGREAVFTMGSNVAVVDGRREQLACTPFLEDGLPMLPIEYLAELFGYEIEKSGEDINLITLSSELYEAIQKRVQNEWEFNLPGDQEGWNFGNSSGAAIDGALSGVSHPTSDNRWDPILYSPELSVDAGVYKKVIVSMRHEITTERPQVVGIYFKTESLPFAQERFVGVPIEDDSSNGEFITYEIDMSVNEGWAGIINQIRVDPFDCDGSFAIDFIRFAR